VRTRHRVGGESKSEAEQPQGTYDKDDGDEEDEAPSIIPRLISEEAPATRACEWPARQRTNKATKAQAVSRASQR